ncbi:Mitogen-activated protein kinase kinase (MAP2K) [Ectocarpus siliculosus]|uniref:mitogen-activated protein kinase kinase n=1 Tax=Ectocarpus siliculosus TaxID=2880 RepID=D7FNM4_ECTSI|nr:Mitogen-activated protein kinase kinase (MAP2K) [Ectocarpus siliculosus]|eukprot:CBJ26035.1 Mitogen-activated protein kinase kinase (MAP2K) [Ectocarpus siliculosus]
MTEEEATRWLNSRPTSSASCTSMEGARPAVAVGGLLRNCIARSDDAESRPSATATTRGSTGRSQPKFDSKRIDPFIGGSSTRSGGDDVKRQLEESKGNTSRVNTVSTAALAADAVKVRRLSSSTDSEAGGGLPTVAPAKGRPIAAARRKPRRDSFGASLQAAINASPLSIPRPPLRTLPRHGEDGTHAAAAATGAEHEPRHHPPAVRQKYNTYVDMPAISLTTPGTCEKAAGRQHGGCATGVETSQCRKRSMRQNIGRMSSCSDWVHDDEWLEVSDDESCSTGLEPSTSSPRHSKSLSLNTALGTAASYRYTPKGEILLSGFQSPIPQSGLMAAAWQAEGTQGDAVVSSAAAATISDGRDANLLADVLNDAGGRAATVGGSTVAAAAAEVAIGTMVLTPMIERVVLLGRVGEGETGVVYRAFDLLDLSLVAVKMIPVNDQKKRRQLVHEVSSLYDRLGMRGQRRRRLIDVFATTSNSTVSLVVEYMDGGSLQDLVDAGGCHDERKLGQIALQALRGLAFLHSSNLIHRDIKPANVLLNRRGELKIADFGLARTLGLLHRARTFVGTITYMSPERINGDEYSYSADVWSLGLMMLTTALGRLPFETNKGYWGVLHCIRDADAPTLPADGPWSSEFREFLRLCLEKNPERRPTCSALMETAFIRRASAAWEPGTTRSCWVNELSERKTQETRVEELESTLATIAEHVSSLIKDAESRARNGGSPFSSPRGGLGKISMTRANTTTTSTTATGTAAAGRSSISASSVPASSAEGGAPSLPPPPITITTHKYDQHCCDEQQPAFDDVERGSGGRDRREIPGLQTTSNPTFSAGCAVPAAGEGKASTVEVPARTRVLRRVGSVRSLLLGVKEDGKRLANFSQQIGLPHNTVVEQVQV